MKFETVNLNTLYLTYWTDPATTCKHRAAIAYNRAAIKLFGEFAYLNTIEKGD